MLINLSNHPSDKWPKNQIEAAIPYGNLLDLPFPEIDPTLDEHSILVLAHTYAERIKGIAGVKPEMCVVHLMGELTFCFVLVRLLQREGITCIASTAKRQAIELQNGVKTSRFTFVRFREYPLL